MFVVLKINFIEEAKKLYPSKRTLHDFIKCMTVMRRDMLVGSSEFLTYITSSINGFSWEVSPDGEVVNLTTKVKIDKDGFKITNRDDGNIINNALSSKIRRICEMEKLNKQNVILVLSSLIKLCERMVYNSINIEEGINIITISSLDYRGGRLIVTIGDRDEEKHSIHQ